MIHVLTCHLAPELDRFRFCLGFWSMLHFGRKFDIFGDVLTQGHNWAKMKNKEKSPHAKDGAERGQKEPRPAGLEPFKPAGLAHSRAQSASTFFRAKYSSTLAGVLPKPSTRAAYICPKAAIKKRGHPETISRDPFELDTRERRHWRPHRPSAPLQVGGQQGIHPLPEISSPWSTTLRLASWG